MRVSTERRKPERIRSEVKRRRYQCHRVGHRKRRHNREERPNSAKWNHQTGQEQQVVDSVQDVLKAEIDEPKRRLMPRGRDAPALDCHESQRRVRCHRVTRNAAPSEYEDRDGQASARSRSWIGQSGSDTRRARRRWLAARRSRSRPADGAREQALARRHSLKKNGPRESTPGRRKLLALDTRAVLIDLEVIRDPDQRALPQGGIRVGNIQISRSKLWELNILQRRDRRPNENAQPIAFGLDQNRDEDVGRDLVCPGLGRRKQDKTSGPRAQSDSKKTGGQKFASFESIASILLAFEGAK